MTWCFYYLLERFLRLGPDVTTPAQDPARLDRECSVKVLKLNFVAGEGETILEENEKNEWMDLQWAHGRGREEDEEIPPDLIGGI